MRLRNLKYTNPEYGNGRTSPRAPRMSATFFVCGGCSESQCQKNTTCYERCVVTIASSFLQTDQYRTPAPFSVTPGQEPRDRGCQEALIAAADPEAPPGVGAAAACSAAVFVLEMFALEIPGSRVSISEKQGSTSYLRPVGTTCYFKIRPDSRLKPPESSVGQRPQEFAS